jgi:quinol monooxygenase YgiN
VDNQDTLSLLAAVESEGRHKRWPIKQFITDNQTCPRTAAMRLCLSILALALSAVTMCASPAHAESATNPVYSLAYIEIKPARENEARRLISSYAAAARKTAGARRIDALARNGYPNQFALLEEWQSPEARAKFVSSEAAQHFRNALGDLQSAGYDERIQDPLFVASEKPAPTPSVIALTHIDVIPDGLDQAKTDIAEFIDRIRHKRSNIRLDVLVQNDRPNHMTLIEGWPSLASKNAELAEPGTISFRKELLKYSGSPYDERIYRPIGTE